MKAYKVIARKWRPQNFDQIIGQKNIALTLKNSIKFNRVGHAFLFTGVRGVGKTTTARIMAKALNCEQLIELNPCNECSSCLNVQKGTHPDVIEIDGASNTGVDDVKALREASRYLPSRGHYKIYIIDEVHMLSEKAFNALLKILEEPPPHVKFIFATTDPHKIPITIKSRCQIYDFKSIDLELIFKHIKFICEQEGIKTTDEALYLIARKAEGSMRDAQSLTDQVIAFAGNHLEKSDVLEVLGLTDSESLLETTRAIIEQDISGLLQQTDQLVQHGVNLIQYYKELIHYFHQLLIIRNTEHPDRILKLPKFEFDSYQKQAYRFDESFPKLYELLIEGFDGLKISQFPRIIFELNLIKLARHKPVTSLETILTMLKKMENTLQEDGEIGELSINLFDTLQQYQQPVTAQITPPEIKKKIEPIEIVETVETVVEKTEPKLDVISESVIPDPVVDIKEIQKTQEIKEIKEEKKVFIPPEIIEPVVKPITPVVRPQNNETPNSEMCEAAISQYETVVLPFFKDGDQSFQYFMDQAFLPLDRYEGGTIYQLPKSAETMILMHPEFTGQFTSWFQDYHQEQLDIQFVADGSGRSYAAYKDLQHRYRLKAEDKAIRNLENVKQLQDTFNVTIKQIKRENV